MLPSGKRRWRCYLFAAHLRRVIAYGAAHHDILYDAGRCAASLPLAEIAGV
jgi:hypothetical protein